MHTVRTKTHHLLDILLDTLFELDIFGDCEECGGTVNDMAAAHIYSHVFLASCGDGMQESDKKILQDGVDFTLEIMDENLEDLEIDYEAADQLVDELYARLLAYSQYESGKTRSAPIAMPLKLVTDKSSN